MRTEFVVQLQEDSPCWLAPWSGDPGRTLVLDSALRFDTEQKARRALNKAKRRNPFRGFSTASVKAVSVSVTANTAAELQAKAGL